MKQIILKPFQIEAIEKLMDEFLHKWKKESRQSIRFQAPTGSGKTVMMAQFVKDLTNHPFLSEEDFAFLWVSIGGSKDGDLASQSKNKFMQYYDGNVAIDITDLNDLSRDKVLEQNEILFFNWSKIKTANKEGRKLRREGETEITWDGMIERTKLEDKNIILIIDEAHREVRTQLADEVIKEIDPRIVLKITATHDSENIDVNIPYEEVVNVGLIKESILSQTKEDFKDKKEQDLDRFVLDLALKKREELKKAYEKNNIDVNPLLMIQLPNDEKKDQEERKQKDIVLGYLKEKEIDKNKIAVWLTGSDKENLENITKNNNEVDVLLFKQAPATGWDCPRAQVMLMYRETKSPVFQVQLLGRILRMPEAKKYLESILNHAYLYTTYSKNEIIESYDNFNGIGPNQTKLFKAWIKKDIEQIDLETFVSQRTSYNDLGKTFQATFLKVAKKYFKNKKDLEKKGFYFDNHLDLNLIVDQKITDYDKFIKRLKEAKDFGQEMSYSDVEKLYKKLCVEVLAKQEKESKYEGIARSYGILKSALNVFFEDILKIGEKKEYYHYIVNDLMKGANSALLPIINESLLEYKEIRKKEEVEKEKRKEERKPIKIPLTKVDYNNLYEITNYKKCALEPCYIGVDISKPEKDFVKYLEGNKNVIWWYKNGDNGSDNFSVKREDGRLFFPDWFIKTKNNIWIVDTKSGFTAEGEGAKIRARALENWLKENKKFKGGLVKELSGLWQIAKDSKLKEWENLDL